MIRHNALQKHPNLMGRNFNTFTHFRNEVNLCTTPARSKNYSPAEVRSSAVFFPQKKEKEKEKKGCKMLSEFFASLTPKSPCNKEKSMKASLAKKKKKTVLCILTL